MSVIQQGDGFRVRGAITHHRDRVYVDGHDINVLLQMGHTDHLCETPGGGERPCRFADIEVRFTEDLEP